jgi:hypothetical protein
MASEARQRRVEALRNFQPGVSVSFLGGVVGL